MVEGVSQSLVAERSATGRSPDVMLSKAMRVGLATEDSYVPSTLLASCSRSKRTPWRSRTRRGSTLTQTACPTESAQQQDRCDGGKHSPRMARGPTRMQRNEQHSRQSVTVSMLRVLAICRRHDNAPSPRRMGQKPTPSARSELTHGDKVAVGWWGSTYRRCGGLLWRAHGAYAHSHAWHGPVTRSRTGDPLIVVLVSASS